MSSFYKYIWILITSFILLVPVNLKSNDLCNILLDPETIISETSIKKGFVLSTEVAIKKWKIFEQSSKSNIGYNQILYYPNETFESYINDRYPNLSSRSCEFTNDDQIKKIFERIRVYLPDLRTNKDIKTKYNYLYVFKVSNDQSYDGSYWLFEYQQEKEIEIVNENYYKKFPFDEIEVFLNFEYPSLSTDDLIDNYDQLFADFYGENPISQLEWNKKVISQLSGLHEFNLSSHNIYEEPFTFLNGDQYANITYEFSFKRNFNYYVLKIMIPVIFLVFLSFSVFWIRNNEIEAKLNVSIVCLLALIAYNFAVNADIPKLNSLTILDSFILISYLFSGLATFVTIYSYYDYRRDKLLGDFNPIDLKLRVLAPLSYILSSSVIGVLIYLSK